MPHNLKRVEITMFCGTGSRHLVPHGSSLGSASRTTRRCRPFGVGIGNSQPSPFCLASRVLLLVLPNA